MELRYCEDCGDIIPTQPGVAAPQTGSRLRCIACNSGEVKLSNDEEIAPVGFLDSSELDLFDEPAELEPRTTSAPRAEDDAPLTLVEQESNPAIIATGSTCGSENPSSEAVRLVFPCIHCRASLSIRPVEKTSRLTCPYCSKAVFVTKDGHFREQPPAEVAQAGSAAVRDLHQPSVRLKKKPSVTEHSESGANLEVQNSAPAIVQSVPERTAESAETPVTLEQPRTSSATQASSSDTANSDSVRRFKPDESTRISTKDPSEAGSSEEKPAARRSGGSSRRYNPNAVVDRTVPPNDSARSQSAAKLRLTGMEGSGPLPNHRTEEPLSFAPSEEVTESKDGVATLSEEPPKEKNELSLDRLDLTDPSAIAGFEDDELEIQPTETAPPAPKAKIETMVMEPVSRPETAPPILRRTRHLVEDPNLPPAPKWVRGLSRFAGTLLIAVICIGPFLAVSALHSLDEREADAQGTTTDSHGLFYEFGRVVAKGASNIIRTVEESQIGD